MEINSWNEMIPKYRVNGIYKREREDKVKMNWNQIIMVSKSSRYLVTTIIIWVYKLIYTCV